MSSEKLHMHFKSNSISNLIDIRAFRGLGEEGGAGVQPSKCKRNAHEFGFVRDSYWF